MSAARDFSSAALLFTRQMAYFLVSHTTLCFTAKQVYTLLQENRYDDLHQYDRKSIQQA
jgi:hypothetical protein